MALINLNSDMGESYGLYKLGDDRGLIRYVASINIACGFHAADPGTIHASVKLAKEFGVEVGAHISYPDFMFFGRRKMVLSERDIFEISVYQIGAVLGFCRAEGIKLNHVKPHGELFLTGVRDQPTARGIVRAMAAIDPDLLLIMTGPIVEAECAIAGIKLIKEGYIDLDYDRDGSLVLDLARGARDTKKVADNALSMVERQGRNAVDGTWVNIPVQSLCIHGDMANATEVGGAVWNALKAAGHQVVPTRQLVQRS